jgi:hypothetical protein
MIEKISGLSGPPMERFEAAIRMLKPLPPGRIRDINDNFSARLGIPREGSERSFLNWEEVRAMKESGVVLFGSHTCNHVILTTVDEKTLLELRNRGRNSGKKGGTEAFIRVHTRTATTRPDVEMVNAPGRAWLGDDEERA